ncbi:MAG: hypothetical protein NTW64_02350 [Candidatus Omnitrophica bacterium]|nr:hypothetical protein [Candidatus Omnitrophota bacterium]
MNKKKLMLTWLVLVFLTVATSGCALIGAAITAGVSYGLYQATNKK